MSSISNITSLGGDYLLLGQGSDSTGDFNINTTNGRTLLINGIDPTSSGGGGGPYDGPGDITLNTGNFRALGDGVTTGKVEGEIIKATSGNIIASLGDIVATSGNITAQGNGTTTGKLTGMNVTATSGDVTVTAGDVKVQAGNVEIDGTGNLFVNGTGQIKTVGGGNITAGLNGDVQTTAGDIVSGSRFIFDGADLYHRTNTPVVGTLTPYTTYKQLPQLNADNTFTGANKFNDNTTEFAAKVSVGTRTVAGVFTENLALNTTGNLASKTINNDTTIQCGDINCGNYSTNSVRAKKFNTRTTENNSVEGWSLEQAVPVAGSPSPLDNVLQVKAGAVGGVVTVTDSAFSGTIPNIEFDPRTVATGGKITTTQYNVGDGTGGYLITQPTVGVNSDNLLIMAGNGTNPKVVFDSFASASTLMTLEQETGTNDGYLSVPAIEFGIGTLHNKIYQLQSGPTNLNLNIKQATASSEVIFQDNVDDEIIRIRKGAVELKENIEFHFGSYNFVPQQFYKDYAGFSFNHAVIGPTNLLFTTTDTDWTNRNTGAVNQSLDLINNAGAWKITIRQLAGGTLNQINGLYLMSDMVLSRPNDNAPDVELAQPTAYSYNTYDGTSPIITMSPGFLVWDVHATFPLTTGNETANIRITMTQMPYF
jgi:hypothetical protein